MIYRLIKGKTFSLFSWNQWEKERINKTSQISWEEFRKFLYFTSGSYFIKLTINYFMIYFVFYFHIEDVSEVTNHQFEEIEKNNLQIEEKRDSENYKFYKNTFEVFTFFKIF